MNPTKNIPACLLLAAFIVATSLPADAVDGLYQPDGSVAIDRHSFSTTYDYLHSEYFRSNNMRCGAVTPEASSLDGAMLKSIEDCTLYLTTLQDEYWPQVVYSVKIWWHVIHHSDGTGNINDATIHEQIDVLNEDFRAIVGTNGENGFDVKIEFELAGITRTENSDWFSDSEADEQEYKAALGRDPERFLNIYSNDAQGYLGYATFPQQSAGQTLDGIVMLWEAVGGRNNGFSPYDQGRTLVHEAGHYFGLFHTFQDGLSCSNGYTSGDLIADTNAENTPHHDCVQENSCGNADPIHNYMNYTDDSCMSEFTREQANRAVCSLVNYRPLLLGNNTVVEQPSSFPWNLFLQIYSTPRR